jgi:hypothetical protein
MSASLSNIESMNACAAPRSAWGGPAIAWIALLLSAAETALTAAPSAAQEVAAVRADAALSLDGRLSEPVWSSTQPASGFVQREPTQGAPASDATEVRFVFDDAALWIGARMASSDAAAIRALVTRRDREVASEQLTVSLDTYRDRRTAYTFAVTPAGVRIDYYHGGDAEGARDYGFDAVWEVETTRDADGWTAEMRIPLAQLRFSEASEQVWGVNVVRSVPSKNERSYWVLVGREDTGWSSRMGALTGLTGLEPSRGIELLPYVAASMDVANGGDPADPFFEERAGSARVGGDLKIGLGSNFTLDATVNPDFGQVEADPAEVNLSAYETFFPERRPFFTEGAQLFGLRGLFYSRRIGAPPLGSASADFSEPIDNTTILGAAKLTGRRPSGLSLGALAAVTGEESVRTYDSDRGAFGSALVAPRTTYLVASTQQELGANASTVSALFTAVDRAMDAASPLASLLSERAFSGLVDTRIRWAGGKYDMSAFLGVTHIRGTPAAVLAQQQSSRRYWQRPDAQHVEVDPSRTSMTGTFMGINHSKLAGEHWIWDVDLYQEGPGYEPNDIGSLGSTDDRGVIGNLIYRETDPGRFYRSWLVGATTVNEWTAGGERTGNWIYPYANVQLPNFWTVGVDGNVMLGGLNDALTRGGPLMQPPYGRGLALWVNGNPGSRTQWEVYVDYSSNDRGGSRIGIDPSLSLRPGDRWELSVDPRWSKWEEARQFIQSRAGGSPATFGRRYVFAHVDRDEVSARLRLNYTFTPDFTLETYVEPFASSGRFHSFGELRAARSGDLLTYGTEGTAIVRNADGSQTVSAGGESFIIAPRDFNVRSLRSNLVLRWEWRPGSTAYLVWQQDGSASRALESVGPGDLLDAFDVTPDHFLALKLSFWMPVR